MNSLFAFNFQLIPYEACLNLNVDELRLAPGFDAVCTRDRLVILLQGNPAHHREAHSTAHALARAFIHAEAFLSFPNGIVLEVEPLTWLEAQNCQCNRIVSGYMHESLRNHPLDPNHPDKARLRRAGALVMELDDSPSLQLALADFHTARRQLPPYSAFYAFRVLEDVGYHFGTRRDDKPDWNAMNTALKTSEQTWKPLTDAGTFSRHLNITKTAPFNANYPDLLGLAHEVIEKTLDYQRQKAGSPVFDQVLVGFRFVQKFRSLDFTPSPRA